MQSSLETKLRAEIHTGDVRSLVIFFFAVACLSAAVSSWGLYFSRVNESRLIVNCSSFTSSANATNFAKANPRFMNRLNPRHKSMACTSHNYGNSN